MAFNSLSSKKIEPTSANDIRSTTRVAPSVVEIAHEYPSPETAQHVQHSADIATIVSTMPPSIPTTASSFCVSARNYIVVG
jgi:hypothetical protein